MPGRGSGRSRLRQPKAAAARLLVAMVGLLAVGLAACTATGGSSGREGTSPAPLRPARVVAVQTLAPRQRDLTVDSPALGRRARVRLLLPDRFAAEPDRRWPVLWLLHGCCDSYQSWIRSTDVVRLPGLRDVLVVMPEAGRVGFYSDWYNGGRGGPPRWETFHLTELRRLLGRDWRAADRQAVAGVSMGGLGAMAYAARHPGTFRAAASYSGILDTGGRAGPLPGTRLVENLLDAYGQDPRALWGDPQRQAAVWAAHNPTALAARLRGTELFVSVGNGRPGPLDAAAPSQQALQLEQALEPESLAFASRLRQLGIAVQLDAYGPGSHDWPYWQRELHRSLPLLRRALGVG